MEWVRDYIGTIRKIESTTKTTDHSENDKKIANFKKLFKTKRTTKDTEMKIQLKRGQPPIKQKTRPKAYQLQKYVEK